jgi:hypothetical protein
MPKRIHKPITFAEFGQRLIEYAVTPEVVAQRLLLIVPQEQRLELTNPARIVVHAQTETGAVTRLADGDASRELRFSAPIVVHLILDVDLLLTSERYAARAETSLSLVAQTLTPLTIHVACAPVTAEQIAVTSEGQGNWLDLVKRFGVLDAEIREQVATIINQHIDASHTFRTIDARPLIRAALGALTPAKSARGRGARRKGERVKG